MQVLQATSSALPCFIPIVRNDCLTTSSQWRWSIRVCFWAAGDAPVSPGGECLTSLSLQCHIFQSQASLRRASPKSWPTHWRASATSALIQTRSFLWTSWRSTRWPWTACTCSTTPTWCWQTPPQRTRSGWTGCNAALEQTLSEREGKKIL